MTGPFPVVATAPSHITVCATMPTRLLVPGADPDERDRYVAERLPAGYGPQPTLVTVILPGPDTTVTLASFAHPQFGHPSETRPEEAT